MGVKKISHLDEHELLDNDREKRVELLLEDGEGRIISYHPFKSMQIIFYDIYSPELPDLWKLGFRRGDGGRYLRTLICKHGSCEFTVNGKKNILPAGQVMMDYSVGDDRSFDFTTARFTGVEITMQVDTLVEESPMFRMLRVVIESMGLPEEDIFDADGYLFAYSKSTDQILDKLLEAGFENKAGIVILAATVLIGHNLGSDLKSKQDGQLSKKQKQIAADIYRCLTGDFGTKYTAAQFGEKYGLSDTTVKKYFKQVYGYGFKEYQIKVRMEWAADRLVETNMKVGDISDRVGYAMQTKFTKLFKQYYGMTPLEYRRRHRQNKIAETNNGDRI